MDPLTFISLRTEQRMTSDMYEDMGKLNALYAELMWDHEDELEFVPDYKNDRIIIYNKSRTGDNPWIHIHGED